MDFQWLRYSGNVTGYSLALELVKIFLNASFNEFERYLHRLRKVSELELEKPIKLRDGNSY
jgi:ribose 5-phosphate isomerase RpiB